MTHIAVARTPRGKGLRSRAAKQRKHDLTHDRRRALADRVTLTRAPWVMFQPKESRDA